VMEWAWPGMLSVSSIDHRSQQSTDGAKHVRHYD
jgi:hypothetical protein